MILKLMLKTHLWIRKWLQLWLSFHWIQKACWVTRCYRCFKFLFFSECRLLCSKQKRTQWRRIRLHCSMSGSWHLQFARYKLLPITIFCGRQDTSMLSGLEEVLMKNSLPECLSEHNMKNVRVYFFPHIF